MMIVELWHISKASFFIRGFENEPRIFYAYNTGIIYSIYKEVTVMDYQQMYFELFNAVSDVIEKLKEIQKKAEETYIESEKE